jgi:tetratricopeptide (TPR) repeat protein
LFPTRVIPPLEFVLRFSSFAAALVAAAAIGSVPTTAAAQQEFVGQRMLVHTFEGPHGNLGRRAGDEISSAIDRGHKGANLEVVDREEMLRSFEKSGFNPDSVLLINEIRETTRRYRADEYVIGRVIPGAGRAVRIEGNLMLTRDSGLKQPISTKEFPDLEPAAVAFASEVLKAREQLVPVRRCENAMRTGKFLDASVAALQGIKAYPRAAIARICLLRAYTASSLPPDSILSVANALLAIDSLSPYGLEAAATSYDDLGNREKAGRAWNGLAAVSARDVEVIGRTVSALMRDGNAAIARPIIARAVADHPDDEHLLGLNWRVLLATEDWKAAAAAGVALRKVFPNYETQPDYFVRMATAYRNAKEPVRSLATAAAGVALHPEDADLYLLYTQLVMSESDTALVRGIATFPKSGKLLALDAQTKRKHGDRQGALDATRRAVQQDSSLARGYLQLAQAFLDVDQTDSALATLTSGLHSAADTAVVSQFTLARGNAMYRAANASKKRADFEAALKMLQLSDKLAPSQNAGFLVGSAAFGVVQLAATELPASKSCTLATLAQDDLAIAETQLASNGAVAPDAARQFLDYAGQLRPYVAQQVKLLCTTAP